jgi:hypothetical protein
VALFQIRPDDEVYRRLAPDAVDRATGKARRNAFYLRGEPDHEISVHTARLSPTPHELLAKAQRPHFGMAVLSVAKIRELGLDVQPQPQPGDDAHAIIVEGRRAIDRDACDDLAEACEVIIRPTQQG